MKNIVKVLLINFILIGFAKAQIELNLSENSSETFYSKTTFSKSNVKSSLPYEMDVEVKMPKISLFPSESNESFFELSHEKIEFLQNPGEPKIPYVAKIVTAHPNDFTIEVEKSDPVVLSETLIAPAQSEDCRCDTDKIKEFIFKKNSYSDRQNLIKVDYLGKYRGQDMTRILVKLASVDLNKNETKIYSNVAVKIRSKQNLNQQFIERAKRSDVDYLIVGPTSLTDGLKNWIKFKQAKNHTFKVVNVNGDQAQSANALDKMFKKEYDNNKFKYAIIVGDVTKVGTNLVQTQWSSETQSDYGFFLMDGNQDILPDAHYGRVVASTVQEVEYQSQKWINYEIEQTQASRKSRMIGIASNEGANPSDEEYVRSIEDMLVKKYKTQISHFYQDDPKSNPTDINASFNLGAQWLTYLGHGDGKSWGSTGKNYSVEHVKLMANQNVAKPVLIDVACQNGKMNTGHFGERMVNENSKGYLFYRDNPTSGVAMYYGGSVNISWHPPAIMARGMIKEQINQNLSRLGDIILAGHIYLMNNYSDLNAVKENFAWYHLFGDPGSTVSF